MSVLSYIVAYVAIAVFMIAVITRFVMWSRMPLHLRWELYPVAHEAKRAHYGGSYLEETDWWKKPRETSLVGELKVMLPEIFFLAALREHNRKLWLCSFPFHFGLYLIATCVAFLIGAGALDAVFMTVVSDSPLLRYALLTSGVGGLCLSTLGAIGLLYRRLSDPDLKDFSAPADIFNLFIFITVFGVAIAHVFFVDRDFSRIVAFVHGLVSFEMTALPGSTAESIFTSMTVILMGIVLAYIPLTHMSHFIGKYFAYHAIRWNDAPNTPGSGEEQTIQRHLGYPMSWAAPHIRGGGTKTWTDAATEDMKK